MAKDSSKIWSRTETTRRIEQAIQVLLKAGEYSAHLPSTRKRELLREVNHLTIMKDRIANWAITEAEKQARPS